MSEKKERVAKVASEVKKRADSRLGDIWWAIMLRGILALGLSACAIFWPEKTMGIFIKLLGAYFLIDGLAGSIGAYRSGDKGSQLMQSVVSLALGLVLLLWTGVSAKIFLILVGVWLLLQGVGVFLSSRKIDPVEGERSLMGVIGGIMAVIGIVFIFWTDTGVVGISWLIGIGALVVGLLLVYLATRVRRLQSRIKNADD
jgi:uncharacterized membrane protein HdeD (DUF308 family)